MELKRENASSNFLKYEDTIQANCSDFEGQGCQNVDELRNFLLNFANDTNTTELPASLSFDDNARKEIIAYSVLFVIAAIGNLTVFFTLLRHRQWKSRVNLMIMHLVGADLMVTFITIPLEVGWRITTQWLAGNSACKILLFLRAFGLYSSSLVLVCISLDRYFAILHPLRVSIAISPIKLLEFFLFYFSLCLHCVILFRNLQFLHFYINSTLEKKNMSFMGFLRIFYIYAAYFLHLGICIFLLSKYFEIY